MAYDAFEIFVALTICRFHDHGTVQRINSKAIGSAREATMIANASEIVTGAKDSRRFTNWILLRIYEADTGRE